MEKFDTLKVSSKSNPNSIAGALTGLIKEKGEAELQAIGAGALNQAIKGIIISKGFLAPSGVNLVCIPSFAIVQVNGEQRTGIRLLVKGE